MNYSHLFQGMDIDDINLLDTSNPSSPNLIPETINKEQQGEASGSCQIQDLIKLEKPIRFEAATPSYNITHTLIGRALLIEHTLILKIL